MDSEHTPKAELFEVIKRLAEISVLIGTFLFLVGWSYMYGYYRGFGLTPNDGNLSVNNVLVHCIPVVRRTGFLVCAAIAVLLPVLLASFKRAQRLFRQSSIMLPAIMLAALVGAGLLASKYAISVGRDNSRRDAFVSTSTLPYVTLEGAPDTSGFGCNLNESNYRLLLRSNGQIFVIVPIEDDMNLSAPNLRVCSFSESRVQAVRIQIGLRER
jgi:hypothetical protein